MRLPQRSSKAFTLIELIVVIVILGILALIAIPTFGKVIGKSQDESTLTTLRSIARDAQALRALDQGTAWGNSPQDAISETFSNAAGMGSQAAGLLTPVADDTKTNPGAGQVTYKVTGDSVVLAMLSPSKRICLVGATPTSTGQGKCVEPGKDATGTATTSSAAAVFSSDTMVVPAVSVGTPGTSNPPTQPTSFSSIMSWGRGANGMLANNATSDVTTPSTASFGGTVQSVASGLSFSCALMVDTTVKCLGENLYGQLGSGTSGSASLNPVTVKNLTGVKAISVGQETAYALMDDGTVRSWGRNNYGQLGNGLGADSPLPVTVSSLSGVASLSAGAINGYALLSDGTVKGWGYNGELQLGTSGVASSNVPVLMGTLSGVKSLTAGGFSAHVLMGDGTVKSWGRGSYGQLGNGASAMSGTPVVAKDLTGVKSLVAGGYSVYALMGDGTVRTWGYNGYSQLGNNNTTNFNTPQVIPNLDNVKTIVGGQYSAHAILNDGTVKAWGYNGYGQLGIGSVTTAPTPVSVPSLAGVSVLTDGPATYTMFSLK